MEARKVDGVPVIAVGMSHLLGNYGLLNLLKESGFKIDRMNSNGVFEQHGDHDPQGSLAKMLLLQTRAYATLRSQILGIQQASVIKNSNKPLNWMYKFSAQIYNWEQWKRSYQEECPQADQNGYGPGALTVYDPPRDLRS